MPRQGLKQKFVVYLVLLVVSISFAFLVFFINRANSLVEQQLTQVGFSLVKSLSYSSEVGVESENVIFLKPYFDKVFKETEVVLLAVYTKDGEPLLINKKIPADDEIPAEVMQDMEIYGNVVKTRSYTEGGEEFYDFYVPIFSSEGLEGDQVKELSGFARVGLSMRSITNQVKIILLLGLSITILLCILGIFISFLIANRLVKPIKALEQGTQAFAKGDFGYRIKIKTGDEIEDLADAFNRMAQALGSSRRALEETKEILEIKVGDRTEELQELADKLEDKVERRTGQLSRRVDELERFHRLTVGRELKMIELKKELRSLRNGINGSPKKTKKDDVNSEKSLADVEKQNQSSKKSKK